MSAILVSLLLGRDDGKLEVFPMEVVEVSTPSNEAFVFEVVVLLEGVLIEVGDDTFPPEGVLGVNCILGFGSYVEVANVVSSLVANLQAGLIGTIFNLSMGELCTHEAKEAKAY